MGKSFAVTLFAMERPAERTEGERINALQTVGFELRMMAHAAALLRKAERSDGDPMAQNAFIDSAALHARVLIDFFLRRQTRPSDIRRTDFAPEWTPMPPEAVKRLDENYWMLNKYLAHLTWERVRKGGPVWDYPDMATDMIDVADAWSVHLASTDRSAWETFRPQVFLARKTLSA